MILSYLETKYLLGTTDSTMLTSMLRLDFQFIDIAFMCSCVLKAATISLTFPPSSLLSFHTLRHIFVRNEESQNENQPSDDHSYLKCALGRYLRMISL